MGEPSPVFYNENYICPCVVCRQILFDVFECERLPREQRKYVSYIDCKWCSSCVFICDGCGNLNHDSAPEFTDYCTQHVFLKVNITYPIPAPSWLSRSSLQAPVNRRRRVRGAPLLPRESTIENPIPPTQLIPPPLPWLFGPCLPVPHFHVPLILHPCIIFETPRSRFFQPSPAPAPATTSTSPGPAPTVADISAPEHESDDDEAITPSRHTLAERLRRGEESDDGEPSIKKHKI